MNLGIPKKNLFGTIINGLSIADDENRTQTGLLKRKDASGLVTESRRGFSDLPPQTGCGGARSVSRNEPLRGWALLLPLFFILTWADVPFGVAGLGVACQPQEPGGKGAPLSSGFCQPQS